MIGLFFGSFNPLHNGHVGIARYVLDAGLCEEVWFVVSPQNPWKEDACLLDERKRLEIVSRAIAGDGRMKAVDLEFELPRPSYTYQTLSVLKERFPLTDFALIIGGDNLRDFHKWRNYRDILATYPLLVYPRPGIEVGNEIREGDIRLIEAPLSDVSSTEIRERISAGEDISPYVPESVKGLIKEYYEAL